MKRWKRCLSAFLAFTIISTSTSISNAAGLLDKDHKTWIATEAEVVAEAYGLGEKETDVLFSDAINQGYEYILSIPRDNNGNKKRDLVAVDYLEKKVYAKNYAAGGYTWLPVKVVLSAEGEVKEEITLTTGTCYYNNIEYNASQAFTYEGNSYRAEVVYQLTVQTDAAEQARILNIPVVLAKTARTMESGLKAIRSDAQKLGEMSPYLVKLLDLKFQKEIVTETISASNDQNAAETVAEQTIQVVEEPALDPTEHAEEIAAIQALCNEYTANEGLILYKLATGYVEDGSNILSFAFEKGAEIQSQSAAMYDYVEVLKNSSQIKKIIRDLYSVDQEMYQGLRYLQNITKNMIGTAKKPGPLSLLNISENWSILNEEVKKSIFASNYSTEAFAQLENAVYALRNEEITAPTVGSEEIVAAEYSVYEDVQIYEITVSVHGMAASCELEDKNVYQLESATETIKLLKGTSEKDVKNAIEALGLEQRMLDTWNNQNANYDINTGNYVRTESEISGSLNQDILDYTISYVPKYYKLKTDFRGTEEVPYGFTFMLPKSEDEEISFDYVVETKNGTKTSFNEGTPYKVTEFVEISQTKGTEKAEHRLYDFLISDVQYTMSEDAKQILGDKAQQILGSAAVNSPTLNIRVPDGSKVGDIVFENDAYSVTAPEYSSGIFGMTWQPYKLYVMSGDAKVAVIDFKDGVASWIDSNFTHVRVEYRLKIEKVNGTLGDRELDDVEDVLYALNLPYELVTDAKIQNQLLCGDEGLSVKNLYQDMKSIETLMSETMLDLIGGSMQTSNGKNAVKRLQTKAWNKDDEKLLLFTYMSQCADANWSLAVYYRNEYYKKLADQTEIVGECLAAITADEGFDELLALYNASNYKSKVENLIPQLKYLSENLKGPHDALNVEDPDFPSLIEVLLSEKGEISPVDIEDVKGIYAYNSVRKNGENAGTITISVKVGKRAAKIKEINYVLENGVHVLTEDEAKQINDYILELEKAFRLTEEEKEYYINPPVPIPTAGDEVGKNETLSFVYEPNIYRVTFAGVEGYEATFKYGSDYTITLPPYSKDVDDINYYCYVIGDKEIRVNNGKESVGHHTFTKEDLTNLFVDEYYQGKVILKQTYSQWDVRPVVKEDGNIIRGSYLDYNRKLLFLDVNPKGITEEQFDEYVSFENGLGKKVKKTNYISAEFLHNGASVECEHQNEEKEKVFTDYTIIVMGDVNGDGCSDSKDIKMIGMNCVGTATEGDRIREDYQKLAADMNGNGKAFDSNDALLIAKKNKFWIPIDEVVYESVLD